MYPIYNTDYKKCLNCGKETVYPCDSRGFQSSELMIYSITHMKCKSCGKEFVVKWIPDEKNEGHMIPVCTDKDNMEIVANEIIEFSKNIKKEI